MTNPTGISTRVDRHALHCTLFARASSRHVLRIHQQHLADELGVTKFTMSRLIRELVEAGRIRKLGAGAKNVSTYVIADPAGFT